MGNAAGARSHWPRHGLGVQPIPELAAPGGPSSCSRALFSSSAPFRAQTMSSQTWISVGERDPALIRA